MQGPTARPDKGKPPRRAHPPNDIAASSLTHINFAFALFEPQGDDEWAISWMQNDEDDIGDVIAEFISLKDDNPGLSCFLSIGGWSFNDGDTASYWSDMASTSAGRKSWSKDVLSTVRKYGFDGVDLDWEYPVADDRGGSDEDKENYVKLLKELRSVFDESGFSLDITFTIPTSYWYLRHFDIASMVEDTGVNWVNVMSYDLHGTWDGDSPWTESVLAAHTNLTEIETALDLLWRNDIDPSKVVLGMGFYGRSFTMTDSSCSTPGCAWSGAGKAGDCTATEGILSYKEISELMDTANSILTWNEEAAVNWLTYDDDQWVSFDNEQTFQQKVDFANDHCLGGVMIWAVDQDTYDWQGLSALLGESVDGAALLEGGSESEMDKEELSTVYSAYTGADCYVTGCFDTGKGQCKTGYSVLDYVHGGDYGVITRPDDDLCKVGDEGEGQYRLICCPTEAMPESCSWGGDDTLYGDGLCAGGTSDFCGTGKFELIQDGYTTRSGGTKCVAGARSLCCNTNPELELCSWTDCMGSCPDDLPYEATYESEWEGPNLSPESEKCEDFRMYTLGSTAKFCCPAKDTYKNCEWKDGDYCTDTCPSNKVLVTQRPSIVNSGDDSDTKSCSDGYVKLCCDPPDATTNFPVDPADLFEYPDEENTSYYYNVEETSNDEATDDESEDPFALVMITGDTDAYDESLVDQWTFLDDDEEELSKRDLKGKPIKRDIFTKRDDVFKNVVETHRIRCSSSILKNSSETACQSIFSGGARNTIVKMPSHVGAGPYARVISLEPIQSLKRDTTETTYELVTDYDLSAAAEEEMGDVNFRVDYTNLLEYWNDITDEPADKRKRWFGDFSGWLKKMTTITSKEDGTLPLEYEDTIKLFHFQRYCPKLGMTTTLDMDANIHVGLYAQYGYYFEGSILPNTELISAYGYFSVEPAAAILMTLRGEATVQTNSDTVDIISGIGFPGLSIKGLISIGPEFALTGSMDASLSVSGEINAGLSVGFDKTTVFFPNTEAASEDSSEPGSEGDTAMSDYTPTYDVEASLDAALSAEGNLALHLTPEVKFGISVLGGTLMEGYVTAGVTNTVNLGVSASASASTDGSASAEFCYWADYEYSVFIGADISFINDLAYWGGDYEVASSDDPVTLVEETCATYSNSDKRKRSVGTLVANTTASSGCFGGLIECSTTEDESEEECTDDGTDSDSESEKRAITCYKKPAMFFNCDYFPDVAYDNLNENTKTQYPTISFIGMCQNIRNYLNNRPSGTTGGSNWMELTYLPTGGNNRNDACSAKSAECANTKSAMWPTAVYNLAAAGVTNPDYQLEQGYSDKISCDEFPFNSSDEGGTGAQVACVAVEQQNYQGQIIAIIRDITDTTVGAKWGARTWNGGDRKYTVTLVSGNTDGSNLGGYAGTISSTSNYAIDTIIGGVNTWSNPKYTLSNNCLCRASQSKDILLPRQIEQYVYARCSVTFESGSILSKKGLDPEDANNWVVKDAVFEEGWETTAFFEDGTPLIQPDHPPSAKITPSPEADAGHVNRHLYRHLHGAHVAHVTAI
nr:putative chitinase [Pestalotiopsis kenyana]